jgi:uncharacterized protein (DUF169 family)
MEWKADADYIRELLGLEGSPIAITFSMSPPSTWVKGKHRVCDALLLARDGNVIDLTASTSACNGGTWHLGLRRGRQGSQGVPREW